MSRDRLLDDETMQNIAAENNLAETAFVLPKGNEFDLRWFTPKNMGTGTLFQEKRAFL